MAFASVVLEAAQSLTPLSTLTYLSAKLTDARLGAATQFFIRSFIKAYNINLEECADPDITHYQTFNDFFTRKLKEGARPIDEKCLAVSPCDGTIGDAGHVTAGRLIQAKGIDYSLKALVGGAQTDAYAFEDGNYACIYLSPSNYHRVHMPVDGDLIRTIHVPGRHFPVGRRNISYMPDLYTKNERLVCLFETALGSFAVILVGAALVGSIATSWEGTVVRRKGLDVKNYVKGEVSLKRGEELGMFKYGSTVICLWEKDSGLLSPDIKAGEPVKMGQSLII